MIVQGNLKRDHTLPLSSAVKDDRPPRCYVSTAILKCSVAYLEMFVLSDAVYLTSNNRSGYGSITEDDSHTWSSMPGEDRPIWSAAPGYDSIVQSVAP